MFYVAKIGFIVSSYIYSPTLKLGLFANFVGGKSNGCLVVRYSL